MYPYSVVSKDLNAVSLYKLNNGRFQLVRDGKLLSFLSGCNYILVDSELAGFLDSLNISQIEFKDAIIWDRELNAENKNFKELVVKKSFEFSETFEDVELRGLQMYLYGENLFVSPELKKVLENSKFNCFSFSAGWSFFAA
jgi:hypothetical protein